MQMALICSRSVVSDNLSILLNRSSFSIQHSFQSYSALFFSWKINWNYFPLFYMYVVTCAWFATPATVLLLLITIGLLNLRKHLLFSRLLHPNSSRAQTLNSCVVSRKKRFITFRVHPTCPNYSDGAANQKPPPGPYQLQFCPVPWVDCKTRSIMVSMKPNMDPIQQGPTTNSWASKAKTKTEFSICRTNAIINR